MFGTKKLTDEISELRRLLERERRRVEDILAVKEQERGLRSWMVDKEDTKNGANWVVLCMKDNKAVHRLEMYGQPPRGSLTIDNEKYVLDHKSIVVTRSDTQYGPSQIIGTFHYQTPATIKANEEAMLATVRAGHTAACAIMNTDGQSLIQVPKYIGSAS